MYFAQYKFQIIIINYYYYCEFKRKRDLASCGAIGGQFGQNITTRELFYSPKGFYCSRRFMSVVRSETVPTS